MKILTDWARGLPPCAGWWLVRTNDWTTGQLAYIDPACKWVPSPYFEWCGLAFNPERMSEYYDVLEGKNVLVISEYAK